MEELELSLVSEIEKILEQKSSIEKAKIAQRFFKTGKGDYAEGDIFIGISIPDIRSVVKSFWKELNFNEVFYFLSSEIHEKRMFAVLILVMKFQKTENTNLQDELFRFFVNKDNLKYINNWDLVDASCYKIIGEYLLKRPDQLELIYDLSESNNLWEKRISIVSTLAFIKKNIFTHTIKIAENLLKEEHDLIQKSVGWMLREVGKRNQELLLLFLEKNFSNLSKTTIRYATERLTENEKFKFRN